MGELDWLDKGKWTSLLLNIFLKLSWVLLILLKKDCRMDEQSNTTQCLLHRSMLWAFQKSRTNARCFQKAYNRPLSGFFETSINQTISQIWGKLCLAFLYYCSFWLRPRFEEAPPQIWFFWGLWKSGHFYRTQVYLGSDLWVQVSLTDWHTFLRLNFCDSGWWRYKLNTSWLCQ